MVKRILPFIFIFALCSCTQSKSVDLVLDNISFTAEIEYFNEKYQCDACLSADSTKITVLQPEEIAGLTFNLKNGEITAEYLGITYSPDTNKTLSGNVAVIIDGIFRLVRSDNETAISNNNNCIIKGEYNKKDFTFEFSPQGLPLKLSIEDEMKIYFKKVSIK